MLCNALSSDSNNLKFAPQKIKEQLSNLNNVLIKNYEGINILDKDLIRNIIKNEK